MRAFPAIVDGEPNGSDGKPLRPHFEWDAGEGCPIGRDPRDMTIGELGKLGHHKRPLLAIIRENCVPCCCGNQAEVRRCGMITCPMWPYRMNTNPFVAERSPELRAASAERMRAMRAAKQLPEAGSTESRSTQRNSAIRSSQTNESRSFSDEEAIVDDSADEKAR